MNTKGIAVGIAALLALAAHPASAVGVTLPDQTTAATAANASVSEQCDVSVPAGIAFGVGSVVADTPATAAVAVNTIVLATATKQIRLSIQANAASFTPPAAGTTWAASDVSWSAGTWANGTGSPGTLSSAAFTTVATSAPGAASMGTASLPFTLAGKAGVGRAGAHTLAITWKVESIGS